MRTLIIILAIILFGCDNPSKETATKKDKVPEKPKQKPRSFIQQLSDFPKIKDTASFITELCKTFDITVDLTPEERPYQVIFDFKKINIFGSDKDFLFIDYAFPEGSMVSYPWRFQFILTPQGKLVKLLSASRFEFIEIFPDQNRFLLATVSTAKGNGGHELYKFNSDSLENVLDSDFATYDDHEDNRIYQPRELIPTVSDYNNDRLNDIAFRGNILYIQGKTKDGIWYDSDSVNGREIVYSVEYPFKKFPVDCIFLYDKKSGHFKAKENYVKKYELDD